jgi:hypothetical protein
MSSQTPLAYARDCWFPTSGRDPNEGRGDSDVRSREGFMENSTIKKKDQDMYLIFKQNCGENVIFDITVLFIFRNVPYTQYFTSFYLEANDVPNQHMCELFKYRLASCMFCVFNIVPKILGLTSKIKNLIYFL